MHMKIYTTTANLKHFWSHFQIYFEIYNFLLYKQFFLSLALKYTF